MTPNPEISRLKEMLIEREKELDGLYQLAEMLTRAVSDPQPLIEKTAEIVRTAMQFPNHTTVTIQSPVCVYRPIHHGQTADRYQAESFYGDGKKVTVCVVTFLSDISTYSGREVGSSADSGTDPHSSELTVERASILEREKYLLDSTAVLLANVLHRRETDMKLQDSSRTLKRQAEELEHKNIALREILSQIEWEKKEILQQTRTYVDIFVKPLLLQLETQLSHEPETRTYAIQIQNALKELFTENASALVSITSVLSPRELEICSLIRNGLSTKEIGTFLHIADSTVERHRNTIRKKLNLNRKKVSLTSYLRSLDQKP